jgi:uncharacterized membrane protein
MQLKSGLKELKALADLGWICVLWTAFFLARTLILGEAFPSWGLWLIAIGILLVILGVLFSFAGKIPWLGRGFFAYAQNDTGGILLILGPLKERGPGGEVIWDSICSLKRE